MVIIVGLRVWGQAFRLEFVVIIVGLKVWG